MQTQSGFSEVQVWNDPQVAPSHASIGGGRGVVLVVGELVVLEVVVVGDGEPSAPALSKKLRATGAVHAMPTPIPSFFSASRRDPAARSSSDLNSSAIRFPPGIACAAAPRQGPPEACPIRSFTH